MPQITRKSRPQSLLVAPIWVASISITSICIALLVCGLALPARAADAASGDVVLRALREEMDRSKAHLKMEDVGAPYYIEYRVTELDQLDASAVFGALRNQQHV